MPRLARRVSLFALNFPPEITGIAPYSGSLARGLAQRGWAVEALAAYPHYPEWRRRASVDDLSAAVGTDGVTVRRFRHYIPSRPRLVPRLLSELSFGLRLATARWTAPDAIIAVSPAMFASAMALVRAKLSQPRTPFVLWVQDLYSVGLSETRPSSGLSIRVLRRVEGWMMRHADHVIVIHERFKSRILNEFGVHSDRVSVIRNWSHIDTPEKMEAQEARRRLGWGRGPIALHAGNMGAKQGLENIIHAASLAHERGEDIRFFLMGDGSERLRLMESAQDCPSLIFVGSLSERDFTLGLQAADVLLVNEAPGVSEMAVPSKLTSYWASGRPVVAAVDPSGNTASEVHLAQSGVVVPAGNPAALIDAVTALMGDTERATRLGANGARFREFELTETAAMAAFDRLLANLVEN